jgi:hypothetical protein
VRPAVGAGVNDKSANAAGLRVIGAADALSHRREVLVSFEEYWKEVIGKGCDGADRGFFEGWVLKKVLEY